MTDAVGFQLGEELLEPGIVDALDALSAVGRDDAEFAFVGFQQPRDEGASDRKSVV